MAEHNHQAAPLPTNVPHVVIIGGGFGGVEAAKALGRSKVRVTLIDRRNHHLFQPLLYQVATATLNPANIASPLRHILRNYDNVEVLLGEVAGVDVRGKVVNLTDGAVPFDYLIVAAGSTHSYMGHDEWAEHAPGLKSLEDAVAIRRKVLLAYEAAEREADPRARREWTTFVVVGGGATGLELAGSIAEIARNDMVQEFHNFNPTRSKVYLIEAGPRLMASYPEDLSRSAQKQLENLGVEVRVNTPVTNVDAGGVTFKDGSIAARTVIWGAGVKASSLGESLGAPRDKNGRVEVNPDLSVPGAPHVFVIGDMMALKQQKNGKPVPGVAPAAIQAGKQAARNILKQIKGQPTAPFEYWDKGEFATIGRAKGIGRMGKVHFTGFPAWLMWSLIHVFFLIGFRNRFLVMFEWSLLYFFHNRGSRLITGPVEDVLSQVRPRQQAQPTPAQRAEAVA